jgi:hypothetical protein
MELVHADGWRIVVLPERAPGQQDTMFRLMFGFTWLGDMTEHELTRRLTGLGVAPGDMVRGRSRPCLTVDRLSQWTCPNPAIETAGAPGAAWSQVCEDCLTVEAQVCPTQSQPVLGTEGVQQRSTRLRDAMTKILGYAEILRDDPPVGDETRRRMQHVVHRAAEDLADVMAEISWAA